MQNLRYCTGTTAVQVLHLVPLARGTTAVQVHVVNFQYRICTVPGYPVDLHVLYTVVLNLTAVYVVWVGQYQIQD